MRVVVSAVRSVPVAPSLQLPYSVVLANRMIRKTPQYLYSAAECAGFSKSSLSSFALVAGLGTSRSLDTTTVPGLTAAVLTIGYAQASTAAFRIVVFTSFAFGGIGMILAWFVVQNDASKQMFVAGHFHNKQQERKVVQDTKMWEGVASLDCVKTARLNGTLPDESRSARMYRLYDIIESYCYTIY